MFTITFFVIIICELLPEKKFAAHLHDKVLQSWVGGIVGGGGDAWKQTRNQGWLGIFGLSARVSGSSIDLGTFWLLLAWWYCFNFLPSSAQLFLAAEIYI